ncbi:hypothetical protein DAH66_08645 [Sphingomonas koreensis]|uniref:DUF4350 domain-containing protein n=1 Tax=Sphingomonas koreensis TaxID=93064 RepID=A0A430G4R0_9SPHN|nr:hypothetical protein [Sphingomonas koreensis]RSY86931.1 hypothetical protein DAH66_08645 [Sphingomonas koreensis]
MSSETVSPFRKRTVLLLIAAGLVLMLGFLLVNAYGDRIDRQRGNTPSPTSRFATGFKGLSDLIEKSGGTVSLSGDATDRPQHGMMILTPNLRTKPDELMASLSDAAGEAAPVLIVLPKWATRPQKRSPRREERMTGIPPLQLAGMLAPLVKVEVRQTEKVQLRYPTSLDLRPFRTPETLQTIDGEKIYPLITASDGNAVLAEVPGKNIYILADPDLLNNFGLAERQNAFAAIALLAALDPDNPGTIVFDTMLPFGAGGRNLAQLMFEPPFLGVTLALLAAALLAGIATWARFGPPRREPRAVAFGKRALIENIVSLARRAQRVRDGGGAYADSVRDWAARRLALPRTLQGEALDAHLDALPTQTPYAATIDRVRNTKTEAELLHAAQKLDDWRKEVKA